MHRLLSVLLFVTMVSALAAEKPQSATETFVWRHGDQIIGRLSVPRGPAVEVYDYHEGIVTTLRYHDGAPIVLQVGARSTRAHPVGSPTISTPWAAGPRRIRSINGL